MGWGGMGWGEAGWNGAGRRSLFFVIGFVVCDGRGDDVAAV